MKYYIYIFEIILISIIFLLIIKSNSKEYFYVSVISSIPEKFYKKKKLKIFMNKSIEPIIKNEEIEDIQELDQQLIEYRNDR